MKKFITLILIFFISTLYAEADKSECQFHHCLAVIDGGSSGSRLHVYAYDLDNSKTPINIREIWSKRAIPGLSAIDHEHRSVSFYMDKLFADAPTSQMPVYFYSTAGMRLLSKKQQENINQMVTEWFDKQYYWRLISARTISGKEEGIFAWLATNYDLNLLNQTEKPLVGIMEIGGASVQIVFPIKENASVNSKDRATLFLYGQNHHVFSHSFLGLGQIEMGHQYADLKSCYPKNYELPNGLSAQGDAYSCRNDLSVLVNSIHLVKLIVKPVLENNPVDQWYLLGGITTMLHNKIFNTNQLKFNTKEITEQVDKKICHQQWSELPETYPDTPMLFNYCLMTAYLNALISNGYGISINKYINILPPKKSINWPLGVVLQHHQT